MEPPSAVSKYPGCKPSPCAIPAQQSTRHQSSLSIPQTHLTFFCTQISSVLSPCQRPGEWQGPCMTPQHGGSLQISHSHKGCSKVPRIAKFLP